MNPKISSQIPRRTRSTVNNKQNKIKFISGLVDVNETGVQNRRKLPTSELLNSYNRSFSISRGSVSLIEPENSSKDAGIYQA